METMGTDGQRIPTPEEREVSQPMQTIMPRWLNNVLVMTCTAMTTVLMIVILVCLAKHFKMKALVSMLAISSLPPPVEFYSSSDSICSGSSKPSNWNKSSVCIPSDCNIAKYMWIFGISLLITQYFRPVTGVKDISITRSVPCTFLCMIMIMRDTAL